MAGYSDEIAKDAERAIMMPKARTDGEDYSDVDMSDDEENSQSKSESSSEDGPKIGIAGRKSSHLQKII